ncbi:helix-turn-helix domain-containing protein [Thiothrix fructosivorans]|uniref:Helix-turn-helix domain-containing protein n=1 Tax=Thiothrix fructosivorans TaxID=111770 RepID=A0A8B0SIT2_9GAMM|nr:helix-turn-helix domain-containing protein [Thiothrix fructosivorans]QTX10865.1 helix-turn-helix domain-containing protein [Thiothrix fructosivorans]
MKLYPTQQQANEFHYWLDHSRFVFNWTINFIWSSAIKANGISPTASGKGLRFGESLPETLINSRLIWKTDKFVMALPKRHISRISKANLLVSY